MRFMYTPVCYFLGDIGMLNSTLNSLVKNISKSFKESDKVFLLGDNFYNNGVSSIYDSQWKSYAKIFEPIGYKNIYGVMGNHDYMGDPNVQILSKYMRNYDFYYNVKISENTEIFVIDTMQLFEGHCQINKQDMLRIHCRDYKFLEDNQLKWLNKSLSESNAVNKIVLGHYPICSNGVYKHCMMPLKMKLFPIFAKYSVKAYISGHEHNIQYLNTHVNKYHFRQFIIGSSSENREFETYNGNGYDMYDNLDNYYLKMSELQNQLIFDYYNIDGELKYSYII